MFNIKTLHYLLDILFTLRLQHFDENVEFIRAYVVTSYLCEHVNNIHISYVYACTCDVTKRV